jgi:hypothetical protein
LAGTERVPGTPEADRFEVLLALINDYEESHIRLHKGRPPGEKAWPHLRTQMEPPQDGSGRTLIAHNEFADVVTEAGAAISCPCSFSAIETGTVYPTLTDPALAAALTRVHLDLCPARTRVKGPAHL